MQHELFIGVVAPIGVDYAIGVSVLQERLELLGITVHQIKMSALIGEVPGVPVTDSAAEDDRIWKLMRAGNDARVRLNDGAALAKLAVLEIQEKRKAISGMATTPAPNTAYILLTLKTPDEISFLRETYGEAFFLVSCYEPREERVTSLAQKIASSKQTSDFDGERGGAEAIVKADEKDGSTQGQRSGDSFSEGDFFVSTTNRDSARRAVSRFVDVVFGHPFHTPTKDEYGMFLAWGVSLRSADLSRQVGAAYCDDEGNLIAVGCNDVPRSGGGLYWPDDADSRDFQRGYDSSAIEKRRLVGEIVERLRTGGWLSDEAKAKTTEIGLAELLGPGGEPILAGAGINNLLEHGRIVHAEMAGIADAARRGLSLQNATLYTTTFPCHVCARHVVAAGVKRVVYVEPYPKSRAKDLHDDSIAVDSPFWVEGRVNFQSFTGIAPRKYGSMFKMGKRKTASGKAVNISASAETPRFVSTPSHYVSQEVIAAKDLMDALEQLKESIEISEVQTTIEVDIEESTNEVEK